MQKTELSLCEQIERAKNGRTQTWIVKQLNEKGIFITDVVFSRKKKESNGFKFEKSELDMLSEILGVDFIVK